MAITISGTDGIVGAGFTVDNSGVSVTAGVGTFSSIGAGASVPAAGLTGALPTISAASLTSIPAANIVGVATAGFNRSGGFGKVLQGLESSNNTTITTSGAAISDLTTVTITPASASNKILLLANCTLYTNPNNNAYAGAYLYRGTNSDTRIWELTSGNSTTNGTYWPFTLVYLDSPNTTSAQTYTFSFSRQSINTTSVTTDSKLFGLTALEIAA